MADTGRQRAATAAGGGGVGVVLVWILNLVGVDLTPAAAAVLTTMVTAAAIALGQEGLKGLARHLWLGKGNGDKKEAPPK